MFTKTHVKNPQKYIYSIFIEISNAHCKMCQCGSMFQMQFIRVGSWVVVHIPRGHIFGQSSY